MVDARLKQGLVQVYTGEGKGKTTAALGLALRAVGRKFRVCMIQFVKGCDPCGEHLAAKMLAPYLTIVQTGHKGWLGRGKPSPKPSRARAKHFNRRKRP